MEKIRRAYRFTGRVQGVGFRWRAEKAAERLGVTGWVRNEYDGSVRMELQGTEAQLSAVLLAIENGTYIDIEDMRVKTVPTVEDEGWFYVRD